MNPFWYYPIHFVALAAGISILLLLQRRGVSWKIRAALGVAMSAAMGAFAFRISDPRDVERFCDLYQAYYPAARALLSDDSAAGLSASFRNGAEGFVNLPVLAWLLVPFALFPPELAGILFLILGVLASVACWVLLSRLVGLDRDDSLLLLFIFSASGPLAYSLSIANTTHFIMLMILTGMWMLRAKREFLAGLIFGFAALIKLPLLLLGIYFGLRGRWMVALGGASICAFAGLLSVLMFGWDLHVYWYEHSIKPFSESPLSAYNNQSIQGFLARLQYGKQFIMWWAPNPVDPMVHIASKIGMALIGGTVAVVLGWPRRWRNRQLIGVSRNSITELEVCVVILVAMTISSVSWSHYHLLILFPAAYLMARRPIAPAFDGLRLAGWLAVAGALIPVMSVRTGLPPVWSRPFTYVGVSNYLFATLLLLGVLLVAIWRMRPLETDPESK